MGSAILTTVFTAAAVSFGLANADVAQAADSRRYRCQDGTTFKVALSGETAEVSFSPSERYRLIEKRSSLGDRFVSPGATLIIDGRFAAFVTNRRFNLHNCFLTRPISKLERQ